MKKYCMAVASYDHVQKGIKDSFCMLCHGKEKPLRGLHEGDRIIYYSPTEQYGVAKPYQKFTALGIIQAAPPEQHSLSENFSGWKRNTTYLPIKEVPIKQLIPFLSFITNKRYWGMPFRRGLFSLPEQDFKLIVQHMALPQEYNDIL